MNRKILNGGVSILVLALTFGTHAQAQDLGRSTSNSPERDEATPPDADRPLSSQAAAEPSDGATVADEAEIVVTGIRRTIAQSLRDKRTADVVSDVITAEDIGKLPDNNVAETMSRVPGVQISRRDGDGSGFAVRGISQNRLEINGRTFIGPSESGQPALESLNPEILSGLEVIKSPSADMAEGALGATVNLKTKRPLDLADFVVAGRAEGAYSGQSRDLGYRASAIVSKTVMDGSLGILLSGAYTDARTRGYLFDTVGWTQTNAIDTTGDDVADSNRFRPNRLMQTVVDRRDRRLTINGAIQYKPNEHFELLVEGTYSNLDRERALSQYQGLLNNAASNATADENGSITSADFAGITLRPLAYDVPSSFKALNLGGSAKWSTDDDGFVLSTDVSYSKGTGNDGSPGAPFAYVVVQRAGRVINASYDFSGPNRNVPDLGYTANFDVNDPSNYQLLSVFDGTSPRRNTNLDFRSDVDYAVSAGPLSKLEVGVRFIRTKLNSATLQNLPTTATLLAGRDQNGDGILTPDELPGLSYDNSQTGTFYPGQNGTYPRDFLTGTVDKEAARSGFDLPDLALFGPITQGPTSVRDVLQRTWAAYAKADFAGIGYRGNIGVRYTRTDRLSSGYLSRTVRTSAAAGFDNWLPSANLAIDLTPKLIARFAAAKVVAQPSVSDIGVGFTPNTTNNTGGRGNPNLRPFEATQYDATVEWYFAEAGILSAALFRKDVNSFTILTVTNEFVPGFSERFGNFNISQPQNGTSGRVQGFEVNYQHAFRFLPGVLKSLGVQANYTFADSRTPIIDQLTNERLPLPNLSKNSYSLVGYYDDGRLSGRLAYTYRDRALIQVQQAVNAGSRYADSFGQLDASIAFNLNDQIRLTAEAQNLNKAINRQYDGVAGRLSNSAMEDQRFYFGLGFTF